MHTICVAAVICNNLTVFIRMTKISASGSSAPSKKPDTRPASNAVAKPTPDAVAESTVTAIASLSIEKSPDEENKEPVTGYPKEWVKNPDTAAKAIQNYLDDRAKLEEEWKAAGIQFNRLVTDTNGQLDVEGCRRLRPKIDKWLRDSLEEVELVDEEGNHVDTLPAYFTPEDLMGMMMGEPETRLSDFIPDNPWAYNNQSSNIGE